MNKNYDEATVLRALKKKRSIKISNGVIKVDKDNTEIGNGTWGKISYLVNYCRYRQIFTDTSSSSTGGYTKADEDNTKSHKPKSKERLSLAKLSKKAMR